MIKPEVDLDKILQEIKVVPEYDRQIMLQGVEGNLDPNYGIGRLEHLKHKEEQFTVPIFDMPYVNDLMEKLKMFRTRLMRLPPYTCYSYHEDPTPRIHIPLVTDENCLMIIDDMVYRYPAGIWQIADTTLPHTAVNCSPTCQRIHIVGCFDQSLFDIMEYDESRVNKQD